MATWPSVKIVFGVATFSILMGMTSSGHLLESPLLKRIAPGLARLDTKSVEKQKAVAPPQIYLDTTYVLSKGKPTQIIPNKWFGFHYTNGTNTFMPVMPTIQAFPDCTDTAGKHLNFTASTGALSCGTSGGSGSFTASSTDTLTIKTYDATATGNVFSNRPCAPQFASSDTLSNATLTTEQVFATQCSIPASTLITNKVLGIIISMTTVSTASQTDNIKIKLCTVSGCGDGTVVNVYGSPVVAPTTGTSTSTGELYLQGQAAAGASTTLSVGMLSSAAGTSASFFPWTTTQTGVSGTVRGIPTNAILFLSFSANVQHHDRYK